MQEYSSTRKYAYSNKIPLSETQPYPWAIVPLHCTLKVWYRYGIVTVNNTQLIEKRVRKNIGKNNPQQDTIESLRDIYGNRLLICELKLVPVASTTACYYCLGPKAEVHTVLAVIDLEGIALSICPIHTWTN